jgi:hypothetical protein
VEAGATEGATCTACFSNNVDKASGKSAKDAASIKTFLEPSTTKRTSLDASFYLEADITSGSDIYSVKGMDFQKNSLGTDGLNKIYGIYSNSIGVGLNGVKSFSEQMNYLKTFQGSLGVQEKLILLSMLGSKLAAGYDNSMKENRNFDQLFKNMLNGGTHGGICGDIHAYLGEMAKALGFDEVGLHSGLWQKDPSNDKSAAGHNIVHFRDPKTGEYYVVNYSRVIATKQTTVQGAVDLSTRIMGPLTGISFIESRPGRIHQYVPQTAEWVKQTIQGQAGFDDGVQPSIRIQGGPYERTLGVQLGVSDDKKGLKGFFVHSGVDSSDGKFVLDAVGVSGRLDVKKEFKDKIVDEVGMHFQAYGGFLELTAPVFDPISSNSADAKRSNFFGGADIKGTARINNTTGKIEINANTLDAKFPLKKSDGNYNTSGGEVKVKAGVEQTWKDLPLTVAVERVYELVPSRIDNQFNPKLQTSYDRVSVVIDTRGNNKSDKDRKIYLVAGTDVYLLEGMESRAAVAIKNAVKAVVPAGRLGQFSVGGEMAKFVGNKSKDPFYDLPTGVNMSLDWSKDYSKTGTIGASVNYSKGPQIFPFAVLGPVWPDVPSTKGKVRGYIFIHQRFD